LLCYLKYLKGTLETTFCVFLLFHSSSSFIVSSRQFYKRKSGKRQSAAQRARKYRLAYTAHLQQHATKTSQFPPTSNPDLCYICGLMLTSPVRICKHFVDLLCILKFANKVTCFDPTCHISSHKLQSSLTSFKISQTKLSLVHANLTFSQALHWFRRYELNTSILNVVRKHDAKFVAAK
jgi:hypothetical protein